MGASEIHVGIPTKKVYNIDYWKNCCCTTRNSICQLQAELREIQKGQWVLLSGSEHGSRSRSHGSDSCRVLGCFVLMLQ